MKASRRVLPLSTSLGAALLLAVLLLRAPLATCRICRGSGSMGRSESYEPGSDTRYIEDVQCRGCWGRGSTSLLRSWK